MDQKTDLFHRLVGNRCEGTPSAKLSDSSKMKSTERGVGTHTQSSNSPNARPRETVGDKSKVKGYQYEMCGHSEQCVERYLELTGKDESSLRQVATPCIDDHLIPPEDFEAKGEVSPVAARIVLKTLFVARMGRPDILWTVNALAREVTKWTVACDKRLHRLISWMHFTKDWVQQCWVGDTAEECCLVLYVDASFAGDLQDSKSTTGAYLCLVGPTTFVPITWIVKKQGATSHSSAEAEIIALDAATRLEGVPALSLWEEIVEVFCPGRPVAKNTKNPQKGVA